jgi:Conserved TM helix/Mechanosensitive ion channel
MILLAFSFYEDIIKPIVEGLGRQFIEGVSAGIPRFISALIVFLVGLFVSRAIRRVVNKGIAALGIDRFAERLNDIDMIKNTGVELRLSGLISSIIYFVMMLMVTMMTVDVLKITAISQLMQDLFNYLPSLLTAGVVLLMGLLLADIFKGITLAACQSLNIPSAKAIANIVFYFLFVSIGVTALSQAKIQTDFIANNLTVIIGAGAAAFAIGYGLASRDLVANYLGGYYNRNKIRVGDEVIIDGDRGKVVLIDNTSLILQTVDRAIVIPLGKISSNKVEIFYPAPTDNKQIE